MKVFGLQAPVLAGRLPPLIDSHPLVAGMRSLSSLPSVMSSQAEVRSRR